MHAVKPVSRREMLYYLAGATTLLAATAGSAGALWFLQTTPRIGEDWLQVPIDALPALLTDPVRFDYSRVWLARVEDGLLALDDTCPFEGYVVRWSRHEGRFLCPGCGSQYTREGLWLAGPSAYHLSRPILRVQYTDSLPWAWALTPPDGRAIDVTHAKIIYVDTTRKISLPHGGDYGYDCERTESHVTCRDR